MKRYRSLLSGLVLFAAVASAQADVKLNALFTDGAVLQRDMSLPIWGTAADGEIITVTLDGKTASTVAKDGKWQVNLEPLSAGGPHVLSVQGNNKVEVKDVLVGEVWLCSGQSNMAWTVGRSHNAEEVVPKSANPNIRLFTVPRVSKEDEPSATLQSKWVECNPANVPSFSGVGYFFGRDLQKELNVPIGLINSSWGGTPAQAWTSFPALQSTPAGQPYLDSYKRAFENIDKNEENYKQAVEKWKEQVKTAKAEGKPAPRGPSSPAHRNQSRAAALYNNMIAPLVPYAMRGAIWYQGEANSGAPENYRDLLPAMIKGWRQDFNPNLTFLIVQLAPYDRPSPGAWAWFRDAQKDIARDLPKTGIVSIPDAGDPTDIHPTNKEVVGQRLALMALAMDYGKKNEYMGPTLKNAEFESDKVVLTFDHAEGLTAKDGEPTGFTIAGANQEFVPATAKISGNTVTVTSPNVPDPKAIRYGWKNMPDGNLWNSAGLPASPFRTDDWARATAAPAKPKKKAAAQK